MPRKIFNSDSEDDEFETEALQFMNNKKKVKKTGNDESEDSQSGSDDDKEDSSDQDRASDDNGSDDEAPESIGFTDSRNNILAQLKSAMMQVDQEKQKRKEKRKQQEALFKDQKEKKMKYLKETRLPDDILENIDDAIPTAVKHNETIHKNKQTKAEVKQQNSKGKTEQTDTTIDSQDANEDYIPLVDEASGVEVAEVHRYEKQHKTLAQKAADFRNGRLYSKDIPRESNKARLSKYEKKRQRLKDIGRLA